MKRSQHFARVAAAAAATSAAVALLAGPAGATTQHFKDHETFDAAGAVFTCSNGDITVTGGTVTNAIEGTADAHGVFHVTGTITIHDITAQDAAGNAYTITGASWFGSKSVGSDPDTAQLIVATDTTDFVIHNATGGVYAKAQAVEHLSPNGKTISFDFGRCEPPSD